MATAFPWDEPAPPDWSELTRLIERSLDNGFSPGQTPHGIKRPLDNETLIDSDISAHSKRSKKIEDGYPCWHANCRVKFNRACDRRKHVERKHTEPSYPHRCPLCPKRFRWPKDLKRHSRTVHSSTHNTEAGLFATEESIALIDKQHSAKKLRALARHGRHALMEGADEENLIQDGSTKQTEEFCEHHYLPPPLVRRSSQKTCLAKSEDTDPNPRVEKYMFVTPDGWNYRLFNVTDVYHAEELFVMIRHDLKVPDYQDVAFYQVDCGKGRDDTKLLRHSALMKRIRRDANASGSLKLFISVGRSAPATPEACCTVARSPTPNLCF